jgi:hypothetical protein
MAMVSSAATANSINISKVCTVSIITISWCRTYCYGSCSNCLICSKLYNSTTATTAARMMSTTTSRSNQHNIN